MKIYLTKEGKQEIEAEIKQLTEMIDFKGRNFLDISKEHIYKRKLLKELLESATILPFEESWDNCDKNNLLYRQIQYPNGIIIQPKQ